MTDVIPYNGTEANSNIRSPVRAAKRPLGVWILTIWLALLAGLVPAALVVFAYTQPEVREFLELTPSSVTFGVLLGVSIIVTSVLAWLGNSTARYLLLGLAVLHYGLLSYNNFVLTTVDALPEHLVTLTWGRAIRSAVWIGVLIWYFGVSHRTSGFYYRPERTT